MHALPIETSRDEESGFVDSLMCAMSVVVMQDVHDGVLHTGILFMDEDHRIENGAFTMLTRLDSNQTVGIQKIPQLGMDSVVEEWYFSTWDVTPFDRFEI